MARLLLLFMILPLTASAADEVKVTYLEQEVRSLQRQVQALSRQLDEIRNRPERAALPVSRPSASMGEGDPDDELARWVNASLWRKLRPGMSELDVIGSLGPPTSMREESGARVLLYAMEIGSSGFLGGSVKLRERMVVEVRQPTLQ